MEYNETNGTNWNDLPSEIHDFIFKQLDLVDDPKQMPRLQQVSKGINIICHSDNMLIAWFKNNFSVHLPADGLLEVKVIIQGYIEEFNNNKELPIFIATCDLEVLARRLLRQQNEDLEIQAIFVNGAIRCLKEFIDYRDNPNYVTNMGRTLLHYACQFDQYECAKLLLDMGANVHAKDNAKQQTPLHVAAQRGSKKLIQLLLKYKADMLSQDKDLVTPLQLCLTHGTSDVRKFAQEYNGHIN